MESDAVNVNEKQTKGRFLTAKYPKHQMGLIRRRLLVEDWIDEQLKVLFDVVSLLAVCNWAFEKREKYPNKLRNTSHSLYAMHYPNISSFSQFLSCNIRAYMYFEFVSLFLLMQCHGYYTAR